MRLAVSMNKGNSEDLVIAHVELSKSYTGGQHSPMTAVARTGSSGRAMNECMSEAARHNDQCMSCKDDGELEKWSNDEGAYE